LIAAIIIADYEGKNGGTNVCTQEMAPEHWACVDVLGRPVIGRVVDALKQGGINSIFVFAEQSSDRSSKLEVTLSDNWRAAGKKLVECQAGYSSVLIVNCTSYAELDLDEMFSFHAAQGQPVSQALAADGPIDLWIVDPTRFNDPTDLRNELSSRPALYELNGYVNRLRSPREFRQLIYDSFNSRCRLRPRGVEIRPGVWMADNTEIGRGARIVAPAFIGQKVKIGDECLITRGTSVECNSEIDFGTAAEGSSILPHTYLGIGLDLSHSIVDGKYLWNLRHDVTLEITDPAVMRRNIKATENRRQWSEFQNDALSLSA
jgi:NDP-sugar pyrophosphorylase family protein